MVLTRYMQRHLRISLKQDVKLESLAKSEDKKFDGESERTRSNWPHKRKGLNVTVSHSVLIGTCRSVVFVYFMYSYSCHFDLVCTLSRKLQVLWPEAMGKKLCNAGFQNAIAQAFCYTLVVISRHQKDRHILRAELPDYLTAHSAR